MKNNHTHLTRLAAISLVIVMCLSALPILAPSASAAPVAVSNERAGDRVMFEQDYTVMSSVPDNIVLMNTIAPYQVLNDTLSYNYTAGAVSLFSTPSQYASRLYIGGLSMAPVVTRHLDIELNRNTGSGSMNSVAVINRDFHVYIFIPNYNPGEVNALGVLSWYMDDDGSEVNERVDLTTEDWPRYSSHARVNLSITTDFTQGINKIMIDDRLVLSTPIRYRSYDKQLSSPYIAVYNRPIADAWVCANIYSITETVPSYSYVTPIPSPKITSFGLDGPHAPDKIERGVELLRNYGGVGTLWADVGYISEYYSVEKMSLLRDMLADGWELGIHFSKGLSTLSMPEAIELMESEVSTITEIFGVAPTSWCSLQNKDNATHARYAYENLGMVWRTGLDGTGIMHNAGGLADERWALWSDISSAGLVSPTYTHRTDEDPAVQYSISYSKFEQWLKNYDAAGVQIVGYYELWSTAMNAHHSEISDLMVDDGKSMSFALDNIGGKSRLFVAAPFAEIVVDGDGNEVPFEEVDGGIIMEVEAGEYQVMTMSAYRADQIDRAISPLYAVIPVVIVLGVVGSLITMLGRLKF